MRYRAVVKLTSLVLWIFVFGALVVNSQTASPLPQDGYKDKPSGAGFTYRLPKKLISLDWVGFSGLLMLEGKKPGGILVCYPNEGESIADLKIRVRTDIARMFVRDKEKASKLEWSEQILQGQSVDGNESAAIHLYDSEVETIQLTLYERVNKNNGKVLVYGNFARKSKTSKKKDDSMTFLDNNGRGNKKFDEFRKSISP